MFKNLVVLTTLLLALVACGNSSGRINESMINEFQQTIKEAVINQDSQSLRQYLTDDAVIEMKMATPNGPRTQTMNRADYIDTMEKGWRMTSQGQYYVEVKDIVIDSGGQTAIVRSEIIETASMGDQTIKSRAQETTHIKLIDGNLRATRIIAAMVMELAFL